MKPPTKDDLKHALAKDLIDELVRRGWRLGYDDDEGDECLREPVACAEARKLEKA